MSGLVRPLPESDGELVSLLGNGCGRAEVVSGERDLNEEGGRDDSFDFLTGCGGPERRGN